MPMTEDDLLYQSWMIHGSYFNRMFDCGDWSNQWVQFALEYLPRDVLDEHKEGMLFVATGQRDGCRLAPVLRQNREVIVLAEHILPKAHANEGQPAVRYFIYVVLHEVVHAVKRHRSPLYDSLMPQEAEAQEAEADDLALKWFNEHIKDLANPYLPPITRDEINDAEAKSKAVMEKLHAGT